jgi:type I restriction enzyme S subunit
MNSRRLLDHFDRISEAPGAVPRLRRFILDLAVRGKLVEQDEEDEPASELLMRIQAERVRLVDAGALRAREALPPAKTDEVPFDVPLSWALVRLGEALELTNGRAFKPTEWSKAGLPIIRIQNLNDPGAPFNYCDRSVPQKVHVKAGDLLISWSGTPGTSFGAHIWDRGHAILNQHIFRAELISDAFRPPFLKLAINSRLLELIDQAHGGVGLQHITKPKLERLPLTLPPLAEQQRIVAKVDEVMALCDQLEAAQAERERKRDRLTAASLHRLNQPADAGDRASFRKHARFHITHLSHFTTRPDQIKQFRQTILDVAVRGRLVPQDPSGAYGPSFGGVRNTVAGNRIDMDLPMGWSWVKVEDVAEARLGKMLDKARNVGRQYRYLGNTNVHWFNVRIDNLKKLRIQDSEIEKYFLRDGDVLICEGGHGVGRTAVWRSQETDIAFQKALHRVRPGVHLYGDYFAQCMAVYFHAGVLQKYFTGAGIPHFTGNALSMVVFPLPPLAEQHRIVAKVQELIAICDRLEDQLTTAEIESRRLLEAVLHEALIPAA